MPKKTTNKPDWYQIRNQGTDTPEVWIYGVIGDWWDETDATSFAENFKALGNSGDVLVRIHSMGGSVTDGLAIYNIIKSSGLTVTTQIDGVAASMASVIALAGDVRRASKDVVVMIHNASGGAWGTADEMRKAADTVEIHNDVLVGIYTDRTELDEDTLRAMMDAETYMTGTTALEHGFITELVGEQQLAACGDSGVLAQLATMNSPPNLMNHLTASGLLPDAKPPRETPMPQGKVKKTAMTGQPETINPDDPGVVVVTEDPKATPEGAVRAERTRTSGITAAFKEFGEKFAHLRDDAIAKGDSVAEVQARVAFLKEGQESTPAAGDRIEIGADSRDKFKTGALNQIMAQAGLDEIDPQNNYNGYSLPELARESLIVNGNRPNGSRMQIVGAALTTTSDFPFFLEEAGRRAMLKGFGSVPETFSQWTKKGSLSDFRAAERGGLNSFGDLDEMPENAAYKNTNRDEYKEEIRLKTFGKMHGISRQAIINDDLGAITNPFAALGQSARRTVGKHVIGALEGNGNMKDGNALFSAAHGNLGTTAVQITTQAVSDIRTKMSKNKGRDKDGDALGIRPNVLLCALNMEAQALLVQKSQTIITADQKDQPNANVPNVVQNTFEVVADHRLAEGHWYMIATEYDTIEVAYLDGVETPFLEQMGMWNIDGNQYKVRIDVGVSPMEFASLYKQKG